MLIVSIIVWLTVVEENIRNAQEFFDLNYSGDITQTVPVEKVTENNSNNMFRINIGVEELNDILTKKPILSWN